MRPEPLGALAQADRRWATGVLAQTPWFRDLPPPASERLFDIAQLRRYNDHELVHSKDGKPAFMHAVLSGMVRASSTSSSGRQAILTFFGPGEWFGHIALLDGLERTHDIHAHGEAVLLNIGHGDFQALLETTPALYRHLSLLLCRLLRLSFTLLEDSLLLSVEVRLAKRILALAEMHGEPHPDGVLISRNLSQEDLAMLLGTTRQTVNRRLADWAALGWIKVRYGKIILVEREALGHLARG